ncbi:hypothetical protein GCM10010329_58810 [Streptomyces spiroverticillatus]|uniref:DUF4184 family protein n=2 Tax=Streptomyces finlayi TaxID=67296 RepID=A0A919CD72_9ACTN|nr:hypothetical protein GCM10010329_58810 [Streptomyces spiroverticillatus]GHD08791.1 hypothetical protein GCM10010334_62470 [Streptomyces finlayi]
MLAGYHLLLKRPLADLAGPRLRARLAGPVRGFRPRTVDDYGWIWLSAALGTATHLFFDDLTHGTYVDWGLTPVVGSYSGTQLVQEGLSLVGLLVLVLAVWSWYGKAPVATDPGALLPAQPRPARITARTALVAAVLAGALAEVLDPRVAKVYPGIIQTEPVPMGFAFVWDVSVDASLRALDWGVAAIVVYAAVWQACRLLPSLRAGAFSVRK